MSTSLCAQVGTTTRALTVAVLGAISCDRTPPQEPPREPPLPAQMQTKDGGIEALLRGSDAEALLEPLPFDPAPPAGDMKSELDAFTTVDECVKTRSTLDPVVGDAVDALGYDTLARDACRVLEAIKNRRITTCEPILSPSLRDHCQRSVAMHAGDPRLCPMAGETHEPLCTALANRDPRLCVHASPDKQATCRAVLARDPRECHSNVWCERFVVRWQNLLPALSETPPLGTRITMELVELGDGGSRGERTVSFSGAEDSAFVIGNAGVTQLVVGEASSRTWPPPSVGRRARLSLALRVSSNEFAQGKHTIGSRALRVAALLPPDLALSSERVDKSSLLEVETLTPEVGAPVRFTLSTELEGTSQRFSARIQVNTYVRDAVYEP